MVANDDANGTLQSQIPAGELSGRGLAPGPYRLCVTGAGADPVNAAGEPIIGVQNNDFEAVRYPSAPSGDFTVVSFPTFTDQTGTYQIALTGVGTGPVTAEDGPEAGPLELVVWPNPVASSGARVAFALEAAGEVEVAVFDALGRRVALLAEGPRVVGAHEVALDTRTLAPGLYVVRVSTPEASAVRRITVVR